MEMNARIFVAGHAGLIGSAIVRRLRREGFSDILTQSRAQLDLRDGSRTDGFFDEAGPEYVVLAAGRVGGIVENQTHPADFINDNLAIQLNVLKAAQRTGVKKLIFFGSSCMYPRECAQPMAEDLLLSGKPEPTSLPYAISKLAGTHMCLAYNRQYGETRFIPVIPNSAYGPNDNFDPKSGHVLSALITRFHEAKQGGADDVVLWGTGAPRREFVHSDDIADACHFLLRQDIPGLELPINIGVGADYSIRELAGIIADVVGYRGRIAWDIAKPDGAPRKLLDNARIRALGWQPKIEFAVGIRETYNWFLTNRAKVSCDQV